MYKKSPADIQKSFDRRLEIFMTNPNDHILNNHPLRGKLAGCFTINITSDWRAVYLVEDEDVVFLALGTHSQLYK